MYDISNTFAYIVSYNSHKNLQKRTLWFCFSHHIEKESETQRNKTATPNGQIG